MRANLPKRLIVTVWPIQLIGMIVITFYLFLGLIERPAYLYQLYCWHVFDWHPTVAPVLVAMGVAWALLLKACRSLVSIPRILGIHVVLLVTCIGALCLMLSPRTLFTEEGVWASYWREYSAIASLALTWALGSLFVGLLAERAAKRQSF